MGKMYDLKLCSVCNVGHMIPTGNNLDEFKCDNPECPMNNKNKLVDKNLFETVKIGENLDMEKTGDREGD
jgi:hypothetical protein